MMDTLLKRSLGKWQGTKKLWLSPGKKCRESDITVTVDQSALGRCAVITYGWSFAGEPQEGVLVLNTDYGKGSIQAAWVDSFHMANGIMILKGGFTGQDKLDLIGQYAAPPGPDWGWRIELSALDEKTIRVITYNVTPGGDEQLAIEVIVSPVR
ncbi:DUF1579 family protein [bacterium]|nr:DUF1579 family protein [candidate division CSSED10-310 bacterium]